MFTRGIGFWPIPIYKKTRPDGLKKPLRRNVQTSQDNTSNMAPMATRCNPAGEETLARWLGKYSRDWSCRICRKCRKFSVEFLNCSRKHSIFEYFWYWSDSKSVAFRRKPWNVRGKAGIRARKMILSQLDDLHQLHLHCIQHCISYISLHHLHHIYIYLQHIHPLHHLYQLHLHHMHHQHQPQQLYQDHRHQLHQHHTPLPPNKP